MSDRMTLLHPFELSGLGRAPFRCIGLISTPSKSLSAANPRAYADECRRMADRIKSFGVRCGVCEHCGMGLANNYVVESADGHRHVVGCDCVQKCGDASLALQVTRERLAHEKRQRAARKVAAAIQEAADRRAKRKQSRRELFAANRELLCAAYSRRHGSAFRRSVLMQALRYGKLSDAQLSALRNLSAGEVGAKARTDAHAAAVAASRHAGTVGERLERTLTLQAIIHGGYAWEPWSLKIMTDETGARLTTFGACPLKMDETAKCKFSVKTHGEHKGVKTTSILRIKRCS